MPMGSKKEFSRKSGKREALGPKAERRFLSFNFAKRCIQQGESFEDWENDGLLADLMQRLTQLSALTVPQAIAGNHITVYTKVIFPPKSGFKWPSHVPSDIKWSTFHLKPKSKEVIAGYLDTDIFFVVFLDKNHLFWECELKST